MKEGRRKSEIIKRKAQLKYGAGELNTSEDDECYGYVNLDVLEVKRSCNSKSVPRKKTKDETDSLKMKHTCLVLDTLRLKKFACWTCCTIRDIVRLKQVTSRIEFVGSLFSES